MSGLVQLLRGKVPDDCVRMSATVADARLVDNAWTAFLQSGEIVKGRVLIGADGARSIVARALGAPALWFAGQAGYRGIARFPAAAPVAPRTVCQVRLPPSRFHFRQNSGLTSRAPGFLTSCSSYPGHLLDLLASGKHLRGVQIWGTGTRAGVYPLTGSDVYWYICFDADDAPSSMSGEEHKADALLRVQGWGSGIVECVAGTQPDKISRNRFYDRSGLHALRTLTRHNATLAGDALHPMTPNLGQVCAMLEVAPRCLLATPTPLLLVHSR
jgi:2-polyprenyl-6-methoxyphenol hydroxylase-like FAD-dependent oxidoreductase